MSEMNRFAGVVAQSRCHDATIDNHRARHHDGLAVTDAHEKEMEMAHPALHSGAFPQCFDLDRLRSPDSG